MTSPSGSSCGNKPPAPLTVPAATIPPGEPLRIGFGSARRWKMRSRLAREDWPGTECCSGPSTGVISNSPPATRHPSNASSGRKRSRSFAPAVAWGRCSLTNSSPTTGPMPDMRSAGAHTCWSWPVWRPNGLRPGVTPTLGDSSRPGSGPRKDGSPCTSHSGCAASSRCWSPASIRGTCERTLLTSGTLDARCLSLKENQRRSETPYLMLRHQSTWRWAEPPPPPPMRPWSEPCLSGWLTMMGRAALPRRRDIGAAPQRGPTGIKRARPSQFCQPTG